MTATQLDIFGGETPFRAEPTRTAPAARKGRQLGLFDLDRPAFDGEQPLIAAIAPTFFLTHTPHVSAYDLPAVKAVNQPRRYTFDSREALRRELDAHGVPRRCWADSRFVFGGDTWVWGQA